MGTRSHAAVSVHPTGRFALALLIALGSASPPGAMAAPAVSSSGVSTGEPAPSAAPLADLSLEELASMHVTTATRRNDRLDEVPAAVWVITQDDIRRSGALSIPDVLRLAPGSLELQNQFRPVAGNLRPGGIGAMTISPDHVLYLAVGDQVYFSKDMP